MQLHDKVFEPYISAQNISSRTQALAKAIDATEFSMPPIFLVVLKGAIRFAADIITHTTIASEMAVVQYKSYEGTEQGALKKTLDFDVEVSGREVIIVEDIVDSGNTVHQIKAELFGLNAKNVKICTLLFKPDSLKFDMHIDFVGFEIQNDFVVGYGLDYNEAGRELDDIYKLKL